MASIINKQLVSGALTAATTNGSQVGMESGHTSFCGVLIVSSCNAATTVDAKIQHSPDGTIWFDVVSFTAIVGTTGSEFKDITSKLLPNVRGVVTLSGVTKAATVDLKLWFDKPK